SALLQRSGESWSGTRWISGAVLSDVRPIQTIGKTAVRAPAATSVAVSQARRGERCGLILHRLAEDAPLQERDGEEDREHGHCHDRGLAVAEVREGGVVEERDDGLARGGEAGLSRGIHL